MSLGGAIFEHLKADPGVAALVDDRIFPNAAPQAETYPLIIVQQLGGEHHRHMTAASGMAQTRVQITSYGGPDVLGGSPASGYDRAHHVSEAVREALDHLYGVTLGAGDETVELRSAVLVNDPVDNYSPAREGSDQGVHSVVQEWRFSYVTTIPTH